MSRPSTACAAIAAWLAAAGAHAQTALVSAGPDWTGVGNQLLAEFGSSLAPAGDFDGDGYGDFVIGSPHRTDDLRGGTVTLHYGSPTGSNRAWIATESQAGAQYGACVAWTGDLNDDGYDDIAAGAPLFNWAYADEGKLTVHFGHYGQYEIPPLAVLGGSAGARFAGGLCGAGDVNGDGVDDLVVGAPGYAGDGGTLGALYLFVGGQPFSETPVWFYQSASNDALGSCLAGFGDVNGDGYNDVVAGAPDHDAGGGVVGAVYVFLGASDGLGAAPASVLYGAAPGSGFGRNVTMGDFNGDGYSDILVAAPDLVEAAVSTVGRVFVYYSTGKSGELSAPVALSNGDDSFGYCVATAGDLNRDGITDVVVGTRHLVDSKAKVVAFLYAGSRDGLGAQPTQALTEAHEQNVSFRVDATAACAGDVNRDGIADLLLGNFTGGVAYPRGEVRLYFGHGVSEGTLSGDAEWQLGAAGADSRLGSALAIAGDVDGDGWDDLIVGDYHHDESDRVDAGSALVYRGQAGGALGWGTSATWSTSGASAGDWYGYSVATAGDVDGDGFSDVVVGAPHASVQAPDEGAVYFYRGSPSGLEQTPAFTARGAERGARMGHAVALAGDVNGDGYSDVLIGAFLSGEADEGRVVVYYGNPHALSDSARWVGELGQDGAWLGYAVATAGDIDRDGYSDVVVGAPRYSGGQANEGALLVYRGSALGLPPSPSQTIELDRADAMLGVSVASAGDVDGDFFGDVIAGAGGNSLALADIGTAFVYRGGAFGLMGASAAWSARGDVVGGSFGFAVAGLGDVDGDGKGDVAVGDPLFDGTYPDGGRVSVYTGGTTGLLRSPRWVFDGSSEGARCGGAVAAVGDLNGDGRGELVVGSRGEADSRITLFATQAAASLRVDARQVPPQGPGRIAIHGFSGDVGGVHLRARAVLPAGAVRARLEHQTRRADQAWGALPASTGPAVVLTPDQRRAGGAATFEAIATTDGSDAGVEWRVRLASRYPWFPASRWFMHHANPTDELPVRPGIAPDLPPPPEPPPPPDPRPAVAAFRVEGVYPNPFNPDVTVRYSLDRAGTVDVAVFDVRGARVTTLQSGTLLAGPHEERWNGRDARGNSVGSGIYFFRVRLGVRSVAARMVLVR